MNIIKNRFNILFTAFLLAVIFLFLKSDTATAVKPSDFGLLEGTVIRATNDIDVFIINDWGYKRLFVNPQIFNIYGHLGFDKVKSVSTQTRDAFGTSGLFQNCETSDGKVYALEVVSEDVAVLHHVQVTGEQAVVQDPEFTLSKPKCP